MENELAEAFERNHQAVMALPEFGYVENGDYRWVRIKKELGFDAEDEGSEIPLETETDPQSETNGKMSLETAKNVKSKSGELYGDIDNETLSYMSGSLIKALKKTDLTPEEREEKEYKLDAVKVLLTG